MKTEIFNAIFKTVHTAYILKFGEDLLSQSNRYKTKRNMPRDQAGLK
jgi:hypothetical protein